MKGFTYAKPDTAFRFRFHPTIINGMYLRLRLFTCHFFKIHRHIIYPTVKQPAPEYWQRQEKNCTPAHRNQFLPLSGLLMIPR